MFNFNSQIVTMRKSILFLLIFWIGCKASEASFDPEKFDIEEITIDQLQEDMNSGKYGSEDIVRLYLDRIQKFDKNGPHLNSVIEINPEALNQAMQSDLDRANGKWLGNLHGIPVLLKDNIDTGDQMMTTAGSLALLNRLAEKDAEIIRQLRKSGAIILGKTNLSEWANFRSTNSSSGWSSRGGQTLNPYNHLCTPCGSSAGSGVAVAANLCAVAIGTETNGSIGCPSSVNGIVGIKPTVGLWSRKGIIPISHTQDTAGPMARTVKDAVILLSACNGLDPDDSAMNNSPFDGEDFIAHCKRDGLQNKRIGIDSSFYGMDGEMGNLFNKAVEQIENEGAEVLYVNYMHSMGRLWNHEMNVLLYEFKDGLNKYFDDANWNIKSLSALIEYNEAHKDSIMPIFGQELFVRAEAKGVLTSPEYTNAVDSLLLVTRGAIDNTLREHNLDGLLGPTTGPAWKIDHINGDRFNGPSAYGISAMSGYPYITVPMGKVEDLPVGLAFMGKAFSEATLIEMAYAYEKASQHRIKPELK